MSNLVEISIDDISDETLQHYFIDDALVYKIASERFWSFTSDWLLGKHFYNRKVDDLKYEFFYDIEIDLDDIREYYKKIDATFYHDKEYDDYRCEYINFS